MVDSYQQPTEDLPIHKLLQMHSHLIFYGIHLLSHDEEITFDKGHEGQILVGGWLTSGVKTSP